MTKEQEPLEVITDVLEGGEPGGTRRLRVYDDKGDFTIDIPSDAKVTFGYFNPGLSDEAGGSYGGRHRVAPERKTALRIYKTEKQQLACFLGTKGFRDESIKLTRITQRMIVETTYSDDGKGNEEQNKKVQRELVASPEPDTYQ